VRQRQNAKKAPTLEQHRQLTSSRAISKKGAISLNLDDHPLMTLRATGMTDIVIPHEIKPYGAFFGKEQTHHRVTTDVSQANFSKTRN